MTFRKRRTDMRALPLLVILALLLPSCNSSAPTGLPGGAALIREGAGALSVAAPDNGTVYVRDLPADEIVYEATVTNGQRIDLDPAAGRLTIDGQPVKTKHLRPDGTFQIFFKAAGKREYHPAYNP
jgi:hypothetical protein